MSARYYRLFLVSVLFVSHVYPSQAAETDCERLLKIHQLQKKNREDPSIKGLVAEWESIKTDDSFKNLDIDKDGKADEVIRSCGNGSEMLCQLKIYFSSGESIEADDISPFYILSYENAVYMVESRNKIIPPNSREFELKISQLKYKEITEACNWVINYN